MSGKSFVSIFMGTPQLEQLNDDLREGELAREAPRLMVSEAEYRAMSGKFRAFADIRDSHFVDPREAGVSDRVLGTFKLETGRIAYFVSMA